MLRLTTLRGVIVAVAALALVAGCTGGGHAKSDPASSLGPFAPNAPPTGAPVTLTQIQGAKGDKIPLGDGLLHRRARGIEGPEGGLKGRGL